MRRNLSVLMVVLVVVSLMVWLGCTAVDGGTGTLKLSLTDAPAANFKSVVVDFDSIEVSQSTSGDKGWIVINDDGGSIDLLTLTNGNLQELGVKNLAAGKYNQIRIFVSSATITLADNTVIDSSEINVASDTIKLVKPFTIEDGITTELIVDFDAGHSIVKNDSVSSQYKYIITPVTRIASVKTTGALSGSVAAVEGKTVMVTAFQDGSSVAFAGTICDVSGDWMIGYLEPGTYDLLIESDDSSTDVQDQIVVAGEVTIVE